MVPDLSTEVRLQALGYFREIALDIAGLYDAKCRIESAMHAVVNHYESVFRDCPLVLYPQNRGRGKPPFRLRWNLIVDRGSSPAHRRSSAAHTASRKTRSMRMAGPLTDDLIHRIGRWNMRDTFRDFDRRATALNEAMEAVARALDRNQKSLRYRLGNRPIDLPSNFPDRPPFAIPPCPDGDTIPPAYPPSLKAALRYAWTIATRLAFADFEFRELHRRYQARPIHPAVTLTFPDPDLVSPGGGPAWLVLPTGAIAFRLSHAILQSHGLPRPQRPILLAVEAIRRTISQSRERAAALARRLHSRAEAAVLAFDRGMVSAQVMLHRNPAASGGPRKGAADAS